MSSKSFASENAFRSHMQSKRHRDREAYLASRPKGNDKQPTASDHATVEDGDSASEEGESDDETAEESDDDADIEQKLAGFRRRIRPSDCLFCPTHTASVDLAVQHMASQHSFFIPDRDNLIDLSGLLSYLGEKVTIGNLCLYCPDGGKEFGSVDAARRHMIDKSHCKVAYESNEDRAELMDFYDNGVEEWEDMEGSDGDAEEEDVSKTAGFH